MSYESLLHVQDLLTLAFLIASVIGLSMLFYCYKRFY